jgi:DNA-binding winged helix-turn-helix (wHTH) protein
MKSQTVIYRLDLWTIYPDSLLLKNGDLEFKVQDKVMQVLIVLLQANGNVVVKEEFDEKVWTDTIVTQNSLSKAISELRKILNHQSDKNFIETVPKKGYRINSDVYKEEVSKKEIKQKLKVKSSILLISLIIAMSFLGIFALKGIKNRELKMAPSLAPNGQSIAYYQKADSQYMLLLEDLEEKEIKEIANKLNPETFVINWSPDGEGLVYNATKAEDPFYSINVVSLKDVTTTYIKFAKNDREHRTKSIPKNLDSLTLSVEHKEIRYRDDKIHHIYLNKKDTIKVFFQKKLVESFSL